jgi:FtsP/CotA-like multicopper oxidase with cupredoxin domain
VLPGCATQDETGVQPLSFRADTGRPLRQPPELRSHNGVLRATLPVDERVVDVAGRRVRGKFYRRSFPGPTLRVRPGDTLELQVVNRLGEPTNLHEHGFHVSPIGISDNVLRTMPGSSANRVRVHLPRDMAPGTYWYHAHLHGRAEEQVFSGLAGVIIVGGLERRLPRALRTVPDHLIALKDLQVRNGAIVDEDINSSAPTTRTVNGQLEPVLRVQTNRTQLLRLANISADIWYRLALDGTPFRVIAEDANPVGQVWAARALVLPPGKRYDVLVRWPRPGTYRLRTLPISTGPDGDAYPGRRLATIRVGGRPAPNAPWPRSLGPLPRLDRAHVDRVRHLTFSEHPAQNRFFINGRRFDATRVDQVVRLGATEEWVIRNASQELHPFHLHVDDVQLIAVDGRRHHARSLQDTVILPIGKTVRIRVRFRDYLGAFVYHCHILAHEDAGMMAIVEVTRTGRRASARTLRQLHAMRIAMASGHHQTRRPHARIRLLLGGASWPSRVPRARRLRAPDRGEVARREARLQDAWHAQRGEGQRDPLPAHVLGDAERHGDEIRR